MMAPGFGFGGNSLGAGAEPVHQHATSACVLPPGSRARDATPPLLPCGEEGLLPVRLFRLVFSSILSENLQMNGEITPPGQRIEILKARTNAFRFPKGQSGNPDGQSRFYHECRKIAREASPDMMRELVTLAKTAEDERVPSVCLVAVLDREGVRAIDHDSIAEKPANPAFDPRAYSPDQLDVIEAALRLLLNPPKLASEPEELGALKRLDDQARQLERHATGPTVRELIAQERQRSPSYGGRSVFGWERGQTSGKLGHIGGR
jgi:hypothetical protein